MKCINKNQIFSISNIDEFNDQAMSLYQLHYKKNKVYHKYVDLIGLNNPNDYTEIPHLPISFFKTHKVSKKTTCETIFYSSGTSKSNLSKHFVYDISWYEKSFISCFNIFYGNPKKYTILGLLPNYLNQKGSSLIYMVEKLMNLSKNDLSGFYLYNFDDLISKINQSRKQNKKTLLIGVSYALLDLAQKKIDLSDCIIIETGGMKGTRKEITKQQLHSTLKTQFNTSVIHSEYGMTELFSQAYSICDGQFKTPPWMRISLRETTDPLSSSKSNSGGINIIDLANIYSCPFIATDDLGRITQKDAFEIVGRFDYSDIRGCNLMMQH